MSKRRRKDANKELSALVRLSDRDIDTSDVPEIRDWSRAVVGRFYKPSEQQSLPLRPDTGTLQNDLMVELGSPNIESADTAGTTAIRSSEIVKACMDGTPEAWSEFIRHFHRLIANVVARTARQWGIQTPEHINDLIQEVYLRLLANKLRLLKKFTGSEEAVAGYLKVVTANLVHDNFRTLRAAKRNADMIDVRPDEVEIGLAGKPDDVLLPEEEQVFIEQIDDILRASASERDRSIFWLHYRHGFTASEIAVIPGINLTAKGVESLIHRLRHSLRSELTKQYDKTPRKS